MDKILKKLPLVATVALLVAGAMFLAGCEKEKNKEVKEKSFFNNGMTWVCDTNNYHVELCFSTIGNTFFSKVENNSQMGLMFSDSTWNDFVWQNDSVVQIVRQIYANDTFSNPNNIFKISHISTNMVSIQFAGYSTSPTWMVSNYKFKIIK